MRIVSFEDQDTVRASSDLFPSCVAVWRLDDPTLRTYTLVQADVLYDDYHGQVTIKFDSRLTGKVVLDD